MKTYSVSIATIVVLSCTASQASLVLLDSGSNSLRSIAFGAATDLAVGYKISFATSQTVAAFGLYDASNNAASGFQGDGLVSNNNEVNLWRVADQALLAISAPIPQSGADASGFIYQSLYTPMNGFTGTLVAGTEYVVAARYNVTSGVSQNNNDAFRDSLNGGGPTRAVGVTAGPGQYSGTGTIYQFPGNVGGVGFVGPNIQLGDTNSGDYNHNGVVDAADYVVWRKGLGSTYVQSDYAVWRAHFGQIAGSGTGASANAAVPEPATIAMLLVGCLRCALAAASQRHKLVRA